MKGGDEGGKDQITHKYRTRTPTKFGETEVQVPHQCASESTFHNSPPSPAEIQAV
jgi:hypothetical protein